MAEKARQKGKTMRPIGLWGGSSDARVPRSICYGARDIRRVSVIRLSDRRIARFAVAAAVDRAALAGQLFQGRQGSAQRRREVDIRQTKVKGGEGIERTGRQYGLPLFQGRHQPFK